MDTFRDKFQLTRSQVQFFEDEGYLVVDPLLSPSDLQPVINEITSEISRLAADCLAKGLLPETYEALPFEQRLTAITKHTKEVLLNLQDTNLRGPEIFNLLRHPRLLDLAECLCGPELIASSVYRLRPKLPGYSKGQVPWHQDSGYFEPFCDKGLILTVWLPLVDATEERGCMWVIPRSHQGEVIAHRPYGNGTGLLMIDEKDLPGEALCVPVFKGGVLIMSNRLAHASFENRSDVVRWSMDLRYQSANLPTNASVRRLPGEAVENKALDVPVACYPPEADFLVRSQARPDQVITTAEQFRTLRDSHSIATMTDRFGLHKFIASVQRNHEN